MFQVVFIAAAIIAASIHITFSPTRRGSAAAIAETYLQYLLFIYVGVMGLFVAAGHVFRPVQTSASIGWAPSPYEFEVGMADLTIGVLGVLCLKFRGNFWLATAVATAVWFLGDGVGHIRDLFIHNNHAPNNSGVFLVAELLMPIVILLLVLYRRKATP